MGQRLEFSGGINNNQFFSSQKDEGHQFTKYNNAFGYSFGVGVEEIQLDTLISIRFDLKLDNYNGTIYTSNRGLGGQSTTYAKVNKYIIGFDIYPFNIKIFKKLIIGFGGEINYLINETASGYKSSWQMSQSSTNTLINNEDLEKNSKFNLGLLCRIGYEIRLNNNWYLVPQYMFYRGFTEEFKNLEVPTKSFRNYIKLGIIRQLK